MPKYFWTDETDDTIQEEIDAVLQEMQTEGPTSEKYPDQLALLERLNKLKTEHRPKRLSRDTMLLCGVNLFGIVLMLAFERENPITTKVTNFLIRPTR